MLQTKIEFSGDFFRRDPGKTLRGNVAELMSGLASWMEDTVQTEIQGQAGAMPAYTGYTRNHVVGRTESIAGKPWRATAVVSANSSGMSRHEAVRTKAAAASIERRFHPFRRVASSVRGARPLITANLTKGIE
jgi:hypothetical protein